MLILLIAFAAPAARAACVTIKAGTLQYSATSYLNGQPLKVGFDAYGYNYQAHLFNGSYYNNAANAYKLPSYEGDDTAYETWITANWSSLSAASQWYYNNFWLYRSVTLNMKWNDAWLSNQDCDDDSKLDRHLGLSSYIGSGAWLTNHQSENVDDVHWSYFVKIVAVPTSAVCVDGPDTNLTICNSNVDGTNPDTWTLDSVDIGPEIWGEFATIQEVYNDPSVGAHGLLYKSPTNPGFGYYGNQP